MCQTKLLFNSLINEGTRRYYDWFKGELKEPHIYGIRNGKINLLNKCKTSKLLNIHRAIIN